MHSRKIGREHPFNQKSIAEHQREHRANGHVAQWFGQDILRMRQRQLAGDTAVTAEMIGQATREQLANLQKNSQHNPQLEQTISQFLYASAHRLLQSFDRIDPVTQRFLNELGFVKDKTVSDSDVYRLVDALSDWKLTPVETCLDMFKLRCEAMQEKVAEYATELEALREEFISELPIVIRAARLPITVEAATERIRSLNLQVSDPLVYAAQFRNFIVHGHFDFSTHTAYVDFERLEAGRAAAKKSFTHEAYHALSGETLLFVSDDGDDSDDSSADIKQQRIGLRLGSQYNWFNEAVTELSTQMHYAALGRDDEYEPHRTYPNEVTMMWMLLENGTISCDRLMELILLAYYENIDSTKPDERMKHWRTMSQQFRAAYGGVSILQAVNKYMLAGTPTLAMSFILNKQRRNLTADEAKRRQWRDASTFRAELSETGNTALVMLSDQRTAEFHTLARGIGAAKASQYASPEKVPFYYKHLVAQIIEKTERQPQLLETVLEEPLHVYETESVQPSATEDALRNLLHLALLADALPESSARTRAFLILRKWSAVFREPAAEAKSWFQKILSPYLILPKEHALFELIKPKPEE